MKISRFISASVLLAGTVAFCQVNTPQVGILRQSDGTVHALYGIHANFIAGPNLYNSADAASFSDQAGLINAKGLISLIASDGQVLGTYSGQDPNAVLNIDNGSATALAWLPSQNALLHWNGTGFDVISVNATSLPGAVRSLRLEGAATAKLIMTGDGIAYEAAVSLGNGDIQSVTTIAAGSAFAFEHHGFLLFHDDAGLEVQDANGSHRTLNIPDADLQIERISTDWLHLHSENSKHDWALHLNSQTMELAELPSKSGHRIRRGPALGVSK